MNDYEDVEKPYHEDGQEDVEKPDSERIEDLTPESIKELEEELMSYVPDDGSRIGNITLFRELAWPNKRYWSIRNRLVDRGALQLGGGKGGSVSRTSLSNENLEKEVRSQQEAETQKQKAYELEDELYTPMAGVIKNSWSSDAGFDAVVLQETAKQGGKLTGGKWSRPDIALAAMSTYLYLPDRYFDVITFEIKPASTIDVTCVYEALAHLRSATRAYVLLHVPSDKAERLEAVLLEVYSEAKQHGIGVIVAEKPDDYETWEETVEPVRVEPIPRKLNDFLAKQFASSQLEQIAKWFK